MLLEGILLLFLLLKILSYNIFLIYLINWYLLEKETCLKEFNWGLFTDLLLIIFKLLFSYLVLKTAFLKLFKIIVAFIAFFEDCS